MAVTSLPPFPMPTTAELVSYLRARHVQAGLIDRLKIAYRPLICPFDDLLATIQPGEAVFDVGCGSGQFASLVAEFSPAARVGGIEISETLINNARQLLASYETKLEVWFDVFDGQTFPDRLSQYDQVFLIDVLHHVARNQQQTFLCRLAEKLKPGARIILKDIDAAHLLVICNKLHDAVLSGEVGHELTRGRLREMLEAAGLRVVEERARRMIVYPHLTFVAERV